MLRNRPGTHGRHVGEASDGTATGQAQIWVDDTGTNSIVIVAGANAELSPEDVRAAESLIAGAAVVVVRVFGPDDIACVVARLDPHTYL